MRYIIAYNLKKGADFIGHKTCTGGTLASAQAKAAAYCREKGCFTSQIRRATKALLKEIKPC